MTHCRRDDGHPSKPAAAHRASARTADGQPVRDPRRAPRAARGEPAFKLPPELAPALRAGFELSQGDDPVVEPLSGDQGFVLPARSFGQLRRYDEGAAYGEDHLLACWVFDLAPDGAVPPPTLFAWRSPGAAASEPVTYSSRARCSLSWKSSSAGERCSRVVIQVEKSCARHTRRRQVADQASSRPVPGSSRLRPAISRPILRRAPRSSKSRPAARCAPSHPR